MGQRYPLQTDAQRKSFYQMLNNMVQAGKKPVVEFVSKRRTNPMNSMMQALYRQVATQKGDESVDEIRSYCRYTFGLPILCGDDPEYAALLKASIRSDITYEMKLAITDKLEVTSEMNTKQGSEYIDRIIRHYSQQGLCLTHPSEEQR